MIRSDKMMVGWPGVPGRSEAFEGAQCAPLRLRQETRIWGLPVYRAISVRGELYETNPSKAVNRLYTSHLRSKDRPRLTETMVVLVTYFSKDQSARLLSQHQEKLQKLRSEKIQQEMCSGIFGNMHTKSQKAMLRKMVTVAQGTSTRKFRSPSCGQNWRFREGVGAMQEVGIFSSQKCLFCDLFTGAEFYTQTLPSGPGWILGDTSTEKTDT